MMAELIRAAQPLGQRPFAPEPAPAGAAGLAQQFVHLSCAGAQRCLRPPGSAAPWLGAGGSPEGCGCSSCRKCRFPSAERWQGLCQGRWG